jgi:hypothetical protein
VGFAWAKADVFLLDDDDALTASIGKIEEGCV